jgi:hypothetical protein
MVVNFVGLLLVFVATAAEAQNIQIGNIRCVVCRNGTYADTPGQETCEACSPGYFSSDNVSGISDGTIFCQVFFCKCTLLLKCVICFYKLCLIAKVKKSYARLPLQHAYVLGAERVQKCLTGVPIWDVFGRVWFCVVQGMSAGDDNITQSSW